MMFVYNVYLERLFVIVSRGRLCHEIWQRVGRNVVLSNVHGVYDQITQLLVDSKGDLNLFTRSCKLSKLSQEAWENCKPRVVRMPIVRRSENFSLSLYKI